MRYRLEVDGEVVEPLADEDGQVGAFPPLNGQAGHSRDDWLQDQEAMKAFAEVVGHAVFGGGILPAKLTKEQPGVCGVQAEGDGDDGREEGRMLTGKRPPVQLLVCLGCCLSRTEALWSPAVETAIEPTKIHT